MSNMIVGRTTFNISWGTIGAIVRKSASVGLDEREYIENKFLGKSIESLHEYLKKIGIGTQEDYDRLRKIADGGDFDPTTIAKWKAYHDRHGSEKTDAIEGCLHGGNIWGETWVRHIFNRVQEPPQIEVMNCSLVDGQSLPIELRDEIRARVKGRKEMYGWSDLCASDDCLQIMIDGDKWCALIGPNIQEGWAGFGDTRTEAIVNMYKDMLNG